MWVDYWELTNRIGDAQQEELDAVRRALARQLCRGPAAQRLAARTRPSPRLEELRRRVPALSHERRPRGQLLRAAGRPAERQARCATPRSPHGWRSATPTTAARCWRPRSTTAGQFNAADAWRKARFAIDANRPHAARQAVVLIGPAAAKTLRRAARQPGALPRAQRVGRHPHRRRTGDAGADAHGRERPDAAAALQLDQRWERALPPDLAAWALGDDRASSRR